MPRLLHLTIDNSLVPSTSSIPVSMTVTKDLIVAFVKERIERDTVDEEEFRSIKMVGYFLSRKIESLFKIKKKHHLFFFSGIIEKISIIKGKEI